MKKKNVGGIVAIVLIAIVVVFSLVTNIRALTGDESDYITFCILLAHLHIFIEQLETSKHNLRQRAIILYTARLEAIQPIQSSHYNLARMQSFEGTLVEVKMCIRDSLYS